MEQDIYTFITLLAIGFLLGFMVCNLTQTRHRISKSNEKPDPSLNDPDVEYSDLERMLSEIDQYIKKANKTTNRWTPVSIESLQTFHYYIRQLKTIQTLGISLAEYWIKDSKMQPPISLWFRIKSHFYDGWRHRAKVDGNQLKKLLLSDSTRGIEKDLSPKTDE